MTIKKVAPRRTPYENLPLLPWVVAETVCSQPYTGLELSRQLRSPRSVERIEGLRSKMTQKECRGFAELVDANCKAAYKAKAEWFEKIVNDRGNTVRDRLYMWVSHWLAAYLENPKSFRANR